MMTYRDLLRADRLKVMDIPGGSGKGGGRTDAPAAKADRTPDWNKWRLMPTAPLWQCVALSMNIDPAQVDTDDVSWRGVRTVFNGESQEFRDRMDVGCAHAEEGALRFADYGDGPDCYSVSLPEFAAWVPISWEAPAELLAMAVEHDPANQNRPTPGDTRTAAATAQRAARKKHRLEDLRQFVKNLCAAVKQDGLALKDGEPLPLSADDLYTLFLVRHPAHKVKLSTFTDDLPEIGIQLKPGPKRYTVDDLANLLAGKFSG